MYLNPKTDDLLQGDIIKNVQQNIINIKTRNVGSNDEVLHDINTLIKTPLCVIVSHSCDASRANAGKRVGLLVSPLTELTPDFKTKIIESSDLSEINELNAMPEGKSVPYNVFYFEPNLIINNKEYITDLSKIFSVKWCSIKIADKMLELDVENKKLFSEKIISHFYH